MKKDIEKVMNKKRKEIDEKEEEEKKQSIDFLKKLKERDKETRLNIEKIKEKKYKGLKVEKHMKDKINIDENNYLFNKLKKQFIEKEDTFIKDEIKNKKRIMNSINSEEIHAFKKKYIKKKLQNEKFLEEKTEIFKREFNNKNLLPKFISHHFRELSHLNLNKFENEIRQKKKIEESLKKKKNYSEIIIKERKPKINMKLKKEREEHFSKKTERKIIDKQLNNDNKNTILFKKKNNKKIKFNWKLNLYDNELSKSFEIEKPIKIPLSLSIRKRKKSLQNEKLKDYLSELKKEREEKGINKEYESRNWNKMLNNPNGNLFDNINNVKLKALSLSQEAEKKEYLLRKKGGVINNPNLGKKIAHLLIDSLEAKLSILNTIENN